MKGKSNFIFQMAWNALIIVVPIHELSLMDCLDMVLQVGNDLSG